MVINKGESWTVQWTGLASKARPALVIQVAKYQTTDTDIMALVTSFDGANSDLRVKVAATKATGLENDSYICLDKLMAIPINKLGEKIGAISQSTINEVNQKLKRILDL
jgi:mRNA interferase MazF